MDSGKHEEEDRCLGTTSSACNLGTPSPSTPRRPLRYHDHRPHQHYYPFGQKHENGFEDTHDHAYDRDPLPHQILLHDSCYPPSATAAAAAAASAPPAAASLTATATAALGRRSNTDNNEDDEDVDEDDDTDALLEAHAASNQYAAHVNAVMSIKPDGTFDPHTFDPDTFYHTHFEDLMASTLPAPRHNRDALLRSNGTGPVPRRTPTPSTRPSTRSSARSVSTPLEDRPPTAAARSRPTAPTAWNGRSGHQPSVKDLTKKFNQTNTQTTPEAAGKTPPRGSAHETTWSEANARPPHGTRRSSASEVPAARSSASLPAARPTQRHRATPDSNLSDESQSFANRIAKPQKPLGSHASKSLSSLSPNLSTASIPPLPKPRGLLFGEVGPEELNAGLAGHGIETISSLGIYESNDQGALGSRQRSFSYTDAEPSSPSDWYRNLKGEPSDVGGANEKVSHSTLNHRRSRSEMGFIKPAHQKSTMARSRRPKPTVDTSVAASKIPVSVRKHGTPSSSSSPNSTRSNSPSTMRRPFTQGKKLSTGQSPGAKSPSPLAAPAMKRHNKPSAITPNGNTRLNAYISAPPPKLSPPLRSSRPRQPVSAATTISSRVKAIEKEKCPSKKDVRANMKGNEPTKRPKKILTGPIDYESRREQIKLSYTKSLRESEARVATRKAAQEKKKKEEAKALASQLATSEALKRREEEGRIASIHTNVQKPANEDTSTMEALTVQTIVTELAATSTTNVEEPTLDVSLLQTIDEDPLHGATPTSCSNAGQEEKYSPTFGIPGSFPSAEIAEDQDEVPQSAISNTTEIDGEPQIDPPVQESATKNDAEIISSADGSAGLIYPKSEYRSPFEDEPPVDDSASINIALDTLEDSAIIPGKFPELNNDVGAVQEVTVMYREEGYEFVPLRPPSYETKVTILGRDTDFTPPAVETQGSDSHHPTPKQHESVANNEQDHTHATSLDSLKKDPNQSDTEQAEPTSSFTKIAEILVGPLLKRHQERWESPITSQVDSSAGASAEEESSAQQDSGDSRYSLDSKKTVGTRTSLTVPRISELMNRVSQATEWTDYSISSQDSSPGYEPTDQDSHRIAFGWRADHGYSGMDSRPESYRYSQHSMAISHSRGVSPCDTHRDPELYEPRHQLPEIDTGEEFAAGILSRKTSIDLSTIPAAPSHSPPPPPDDIFLRGVMDSIPPSEYTDETRPNSYIQDDKDGESPASVDSLKRDSGYFAPSESALQSIDQRSLAASEDPKSSSSRLASQQTLAESNNAEQVADLPAKEKKRLFTRHETIKELIDTETFFIRDMNIVEEIYKGTAEACPKLDDQTIKLIFRNTDKIILFHSAFLVELKEGVSSVYTPKTHRQVQKDTSSSSDGVPSSSSVAMAASGQLNNEKDRETSLGPTFLRHIEDMKQVHETFLKNSDNASKRLIQIQEDPTVQVWLNECNEVARELTRAWNLDSLLIKPMQRITKYPNLLSQILHETPSDHPDRPSLEAAKIALENAIEEINKTKKNFELVGQIVGRRRKESDVKAGFARAFGKRVDKLQTPGNKPSEDAEYLKLHERFGDDYLRLQVVLRDVEFYTRQVTVHVHEFLQYLSSMELVMRLQPSPHPEIESKWVRFNVSMRDIEKVALEQHLSQVRKHVIEPFELVIKSYSNPSLAMKKRSKRRVDYEKYIQLQKSGKKIDKQLSELVEQYNALNEALKKELPKLSTLTEKVGNICLGNFVNIQAEWFSIWKEKVKVVLGDTNVPELSSIVTGFFQDYKFQEEQINMIGIVNPASKGRPSHSTSVDEASSRFRLRPAEPSPRHRGLSLNSDIAPSLPTPDFMKRHSGQFAVSPSVTSMSSPGQSCRDYYNVSSGHTRPPADSPKTLEFASASRSLAAAPARPGTGQSHDSGGQIRQSVESNSQSGRHSSSTQASPYQSPDNHRYSGIFQSALPMSDAHERHIRPSQVSSRASSRERQPINGYNVLWLAASLFEFNIQTTKHEAGYPYLTYQAGEIFDVIAEKGELWLAKNQDDPNNLVGWLWSKHFAKLADD
ncbi:putative rho guanyl nucleotide exchange factor [Rosellinia necatrix]|uniref:Putative rho guanyl nucleotide exchange factor n=1 Tax=Rosellinia necatrix TaxID=77044 RepID=A0A1W2TDU2_ROSNE|nr:putative rho guanyl nucleotide exchange factor [Rosellinia necatrix]